MTTRGGKRTGAGRKPGNRKYILYGRVSEETYNKVHREALAKEMSISEYLDWMLGPYRKIINIEINGETRKI